MYLSYSVYVDCLQWTNLLHSHLIDFPVNHIRFLPLGVKYLTCCVKNNIFIPVSSVQNVNGTAKSSASSGPVGADFKPLQTTATATSYQSPPVTSTGNYTLNKQDECQSVFQPIH